MANEDQDSRTEAPTGQRITKAREEGDIFKSVEIQSLAVLLAMMVFVWLTGRWVAVDLSRVLASVLGKISQFPADEESVRALIVKLVEEAALICAAPIGITFAFAMLATVMQTGINFAPDKILKFNIGAFNPIAGFGRMFSGRKVVDFFKSIFKMIIISSIIGMVVIPHMVHPDIMVQEDPRQMLHDLQILVVRLIFAAVLTFMVVALLDWLWERYSYYKKLKMTKQEVKDEARQMEGDQVVKSRIKAIRRQRARQRMLAAIPKATVVITNPTHYAVALQYDMETMPAPRLVGKGVDHLAFRIRELAEENDVPIMENPPLARLLYATVEVDQDIPPEHYKAVAEVIGFVMRLKGRWRPTAKKRDDKPSSRPGLQA